MKTPKFLLMVGVLLLGSAILFSGCKKKEEDPPAPPTFVVTAQPQGDILYFGAYCSTDDVRLTKVTIKDPLNNSYTYNAGGEVWVKDELIIIPDGYDKLLGSWRFVFDGTVISDGRAFSVTASITVTGK